MCGIVGIIEKKAHPVDAEILKAMTESLAHRGPDGDGVFCTENVGLGHRRLSIIDLSEVASQPMKSSDGRFVITYNGEIYNYRELRAELIKLGHQFGSQSDTEVLLHSFMEWREDCFAKLNGMFALAVFDAKERRVYLARDRYGIKPLYYFAQNGIFLFASEIKAFLKHPAFRAEPDKRALLEYFTFQNIFTDRTWFSGVKLFPAGTVLQISTEYNQEKSWRRYWDYHFTEPSQIRSEEDYLSELDSLFAQAIKRQLVGDVEVGAYLSGGMDSGSITAIAAQSLPSLKTFTCGFDMSTASRPESNFDERKKARILATHFRTQHFERKLRSGDMERILPKLTWHLEDPRVGQSYPNYFAAELASESVKVVLSGTGGDELFGGYPWRYYRAAVNHDFENYIDKYYLFWQRLIPNSAIKKLFSPVWQDVHDVWTRDIFRDVFATHANELDSPECYINHSLYFEAKTFLHGLLLLEDKLGMAHGIETRFPFLDNDLVDFCMKLPVKHKLGHLGDVVRLNENEPGIKTSRYFEKTRDGKLLLRKVMQRHLPREVTEREKQGFSAPDASWFKGESVDYVKSCIFNKNARMYDIIDFEMTKTLVEDHLEGRQNRRLFIWSLLSFDNWCRIFWA